MTGFTEKLMKLKRPEPNQYEVVNHFIQGVRSLNAVHGHLEMQYGDARCTVKLLGTSLTGPYPDPEGTMYCSSAKQIVKGLRGAAEEEATALHNLVKVKLDSRMQSTADADLILEAIENLAKRKLGEL